MNSNIVMVGTLFDGDRLTHIVINNLHKKSVQFLKVEEISFEEGAEILEKLKVEN